MQSPSSSCRAIHCHPTQTHRDDTPRRRLILNRRVKEEWTDDDPISVFQLSRQHMFCSCCLLFVAVVVGRCPSSSSSSSSSSSAAIMLQDKTLKFSLYIFVEGGGNPPKRRKLYLLPPHFFLARFLSWCCSAPTRVFPRRFKAMTTSLRAIVLRPKVSLYINE